VALAEDASPGPYRLSPDNRQHYLWTLSTSSDYNPQDRPSPGPGTSMSIVPGHRTTVSGDVPLHPQRLPRQGRPQQRRAVDLYDGIVALQVGAGALPLSLRSDYGPSGVDVNGDNKVGLAEILYILQLSATVR
jgi:hypothetical protein